MMSLAEEKNNRDRIQSRKGGSSSGAIETKTPGELRGTVAQPQRRWPGWPGWPQGSGAQGASCGISSSWSQSSLLKGRNRQGLLQDATSDLEISGDIWRKMRISWYVRIVDPPMTPNGFCTEIGSGVRSDNAMKRKTSREKTLQGSYQMARKAYRSFWFSWKCLGRECHGVPSDRSVL